MSKVVVPDRLINAFKAECSRKHHDAVALLRRDLLQFDVFAHFNLLVFGLQPIETLVPRLRRPFLVLKPLAFGFELIISVSPDLEVLDQPHEVLTVADKCQLSAAVFRDVCQLFCDAWYRFIFFNPFSNQANLLKTVRDEEF